MRGIADQPAAFMQRFPHEPDIAHHTERVIMIRDGKLASDRKNGERARRSEWQHMLSEQPSAAPAEGSAQ